MIYTLTLNPSLDHVITVQQLQMGETNRAQKEQILAGGKGINVSTVLTNLGVKNVALGLIGGHTGRQIQDMLLDQKIQTDFLHLEGKDSRINTKIKECDLCGNVILETEINSPGPCISEEEWVKLQTRLLDIEDGSFFICSGSLPKAQVPISYAAICETLKEKQISLVIDTAGQALLDTLKYRPFLIKPNKEELETLFGEAITSKADALDYAQKLVQMGARNVIVSMGKEGGVFFSETGAYDEVEAPCGTLINSVGAGDSLIAGFMAYYLEHESQTDALTRAFRYGICTASASAFSKELATKEEADILFKLI